MPSYRQFYGGSLLSAKSLGKRTIKGKIVLVEVKTTTAKDGTEKTQLVLTIQGQDKLIPLNSGNAKRLGDKYGENYDKWVGKTVTVSTHNVEFNGDATRGLLVTPTSK